MHLLRTIVLGFLLTLSIPALAEVKPARVFSDNMILQQEMPIRVWGWADKGEKVTVSFAGQSGTATAGDDGYWRVDLKPLKADGKTHMLKIMGNNTIELKNIKLGEVWLAAGQSNMNRETDIGGDFPDIRLFWVHGAVTPIERDLGENAMGWEPATLERIAAVTPIRKEKFHPNHKNGFAEVGWVVGKQVREAKNVPVGLIKSAFGGSQARAWTPIDNFTEKYTYGKAEEGGYIGHRPGLLYNTMLEGLGPLSIRGVVWYQGENNGRDWDYDKELSAMIKSWRELFEQPELPFYLAQIGQTTYASGMLRVWECQAKVAAEDPNVHLAMSVNLFDSLEKGKGDAVREHTGNERDPGTGWPIAGGSNPHPPNKHIVAGRIGNLVLVHTYGMKLDNEVHSPVYDSHTVQGDKLVIRFKHVGDGLKTDDGQSPNWFEVSDGTQADRKGPSFPLIYHQATAKIVGKDTVEVSAPGVTNPKHVRLAWHMLARQNLVNSEGLPAVNFRTDEQKTKNR